MTVAQIPSQLIGDVAYANFEGIIIPYIILPLFLSDEDELVPVTFTAKVIREGIALGRKLSYHSIQNDTNVERALRFQRDINRCLAQYEEVYKDLKKNSKQFFIWA